MTEATIPMGKPIPEGLACGDQFTEEELVQLRKLREIVKTKYPLLNVRMDDNFMARWLFSYKDMTPERAAEKLYALFKFRKEYPKYISSEPLEYFDTFIKTNCKLMLKHRDREGRRIYLCKLADYIKAPDMYQVSKLDDIWFEAVLNEPQTYRKGVAVLMDVKGISWQLLKWLQPAHGRAMSLKNEVAPIEIHYHVVNTSSLTKAAIPFIFKFMSSERKKHVHFHFTDVASLHKFIAPESLPSEYGGTGEPIDYEEQQRTLLFENEGRLLEAMSYSLLDPKPQNWDNVCR